MITAALRKDLHSTPATRSLSRWYSLEGGGEVYVRINSVHLIENSLKMCVDVANVSVRRKREGVFSRFLVALELEVQRSNHLYGIFIENIMPVWLLSPLYRRGYRFVDQNFDLPCMYKDLNSEYHGENSFERP